MLQYENDWNLATTDIVEQIDLMFLSELGFILHIKNDS